MSDKSKISSSTSGSSTNDTSGGDKTSMKTPEWRSATVVKTFLRFAVSSILYHRQILPLECFEKRDFCGLKRLPFIDCVDDEGNITNSEGKFYMVHVISNGNYFDHAMICLCGIFTIF